MKALIISTDRFEDSELFYPYYRLKEKGLEVEVATTDGDDITGKHGTEIDGDLKIEEARPENYDLLVIPGGRSPEHLRVDAPKSIEIVKKFDNMNKTIAAICHGAQLMMSADILDGREATCYWTIRDDLENAGGSFVDEPVVVDENLVTSRVPSDLPHFMGKVIEKLDS